MFDFLRRYQNLGIAFAIALFFFSSLGGYQVAFQGVAWAKMIAQYSRTDAPVQALKKTFDGKHPCSVCKRISKSHSSNMSPTINPDLKFEKAFVSAAVSVKRMRDCGQLSYSCTSANLIRNDSSPLTPPPRA